MKLSKVKKNKNKSQNIIKIEYINKRCKRNLWNLLILILRMSLINIIPLINRY